MQVDVDFKTLLAVVGAAAGLYGGVGKAYLQLKEQILTKRVDDLEKAIGDLRASLASTAAKQREKEEQVLHDQHQREVRLTQLDGDLNLERERVKNMTETLSETIPKLATREELREVARGHEKQIDALAADVRRLGPGRYQSTSAQSVAPPRPVK